LHSAINSPRPVPEDATVRYILNAGMSRFRVQAFVTGLLSAFGHNPVIAIRQFSGEAQFDPRAPERAVLRMIIEAASLEADGNINEKDRAEIQRIMHQEVLESEGYSEITYECSKVAASSTGEGGFWIVLSGELTLHGVTCAQRVAGSLRLDGSTLRASGEFSLRQSDYQLKLASGLGGALKVKDELKCSFDIAATRAE
jgi:polyisoprenoid-binding protein YceI